MLKALRLTTSAIALSAVLAGSALAGAFDVNKTVTGLAMRGYDPVAYFTVGAPTPGSFAITSVHDGAVYRFSSEENKAKFEANPAAYLPQYGGFCAFGLAQGVKVDGDPKLWKVVDNKLYLNLSEPVQERWQGDIPGYIEAADDKWPALEDTDPVETVN